MIGNANSSLNDEALADRLLAERDTISHFVEYLEDLERRILALESRFGVASEDLSNAIENRKIQETEEVCNWLMDYELLQRAKVVAR